MIFKLLVGFLVATTAVLFHGAALALNRPKKAAEIRCAALELRAQFAETKLALSDGNLAISAIKTFSDHHQAPVLTDPQIKAIARAITANMPVKQERIH
jgi:hypothetical protein